MASAILRSSKAQRLCAVRRWEPAPAFIQKQYSFLMGREGPTVFGDSAVEDDSEFDTDLRYRRQELYNITEQVS